MKILIPMAGEGSRFREAGYDVPKPFIDVRAKPMIQRVVESLPIGSAYIYIVRESHFENYDVESTLTTITPVGSECHIVKVPKLTDGAACTALLAKDIYNDHEDLLIANSDQIVKYNMDNFNIIKNMSPDGIVLTFYNNHPKWSYVLCAGDMSIEVVAEKKPISNMATCGIYWYRYGYDFADAAEAMIAKGNRVNNEFYIAPVYNEIIADGGLVVPFFVDEMHGLGTPEDLLAYLTKS